MASTENDKIGWLCSYTPVEIITAAGFEPNRISGHNEPPRVADTYMSSNMCQFVRSVIDMVAEGNYDNLRGVIFVNSCDPMRRLHDVWQHIRPDQFLYMIDLPIHQSPADQAYFTQEIARLRDALEQFSGHEITDDAIVQAIQSYHQAREIYYALLAARGNIPARLSTMELDAITERFFNSSIEEWTKDAKIILNKKSVVKKAQVVGHKPRILLAGSPVHDHGLVSMIQDSGMDVVFENTCTGSRFFEIIVDETGNPIHDLGAAYFNKPSCARMMQLPDRANFIIEKAKEFSVDGIIHFALKFCDTYQYDVPELKKILEEAGLNVLTIEVDCLGSNVGQLKTRFESFKEMLENKEG
ncbi:MAG TPA: 2-hydroxyacyl-CoA dehydratase family protein [Candidatus Lokiarchaeia archaeon]|nr:2-hydroxyacyl-CoA dehydratase family protein [Candidatus Lokiarchaeia archaeon]